MQSNDLNEQIRLLTEQNRNLLADNAKIKDDYSDVQFTHAASMCEIEFNTQKETGELKSTLKFKNQELQTLNRQHTQALREISSLKQGQPQKSNINIIQSTERERWGNG